ncbi:hypothetical protein [Halomicrococcus gelatinilyticus]|uniref:hypothetical protein n=1 Tax=Halomicrococcus gelatinilyticus TaxID=1702103 RepID=UPI002E134F38
MDESADAVNRRHFARALGAAIVAGLAGCTTRVSPFSSSSDRKPIGLVVRTYLESQRTIEVVIDDLDSDARYRQKFTLVPGDVIRRPSILEAGTYEVRVQVKDEMWQSTKWEMGDCRSDDIHIELGTGGIGVGSTCHE